MLLLFSAIEFSLQLDFMKRFFLLLKSYYHKFSKAKSYKNENYVNFTKTIADFVDHL